MKSKVLVVDDFPIIHELVETALMDDGYQLYRAFNATAALSMAEELKPDLVLLDVGLPDLDGFEVCRRLKADPATSRIGVIFLTAADSPGDRIRGLELSTVDYILKPFDCRELAIRVRSALRAIRMAHLLLSAGMGEVDATDNLHAGGIPKLRINQIFQARSKNPWCRRPPIVKKENAVME